LNNFKKKAATRIAIVSVALSFIASTVSWFVAREKAESSIVSLAIEESGRILHQNKAINLSSSEAKEHALQAANAIVGGLFDVAEIYDNHGIRLALAVTQSGAFVELTEPRHQAPRYTKVSYESMHLPGGLWGLRVFVPLHSSGDMTQPITGYFEGVRVVPEWQHRQILASSLTVATMVGLAALLCGMVTYPVVVSISTENEQKTLELLDSHISMMEALGRAIAKRDSDTGVHNYRVAWIASKIAEKMGMNNSEMQSLIAGSFLHDVGKIGVPDAILLKPGRLDEAEFKIMQTHVEQGEEIVTGMGWLDGAHDVVASHHEKWDGGGYPRQLCGESIPISARIFAVADVFDALCSKRLYKESLGFEETMAILHEDTGTHFDPAVMAVFSGMARGIFDRLQSSSEEDVQKLLEAQVRRHFAI